MTSVSSPPEGGNLSKEQIAARDAVIEGDFRAGIKPLRQIGAEHDMSHTMVAKMAKAHGWMRDLTGRIRAKADAKVAKAAVSKEVSKERAATENQVVEANAQLQYQIRLSHRADIQRGRALFATLLTELEAVGLNVSELEALFDMLNDPEPGNEPSKAQSDRVQKAREQLSKVLSMHGRIDSAKRLVEMLEKLVKMERQAFGIGDDDEGDGGSHPAGAASSRIMSDVERAVRLARLLAGTP